ncbi:MAG: ParB/RepB/Spo0J family partition protein [Oscillospiraceae bacterium]|jgi:ParB family chromosome partitioning protein|nr:ParB/RepB/Spo0J family partition protein [Oscillospiraceae bacterium]
MAFSNVFFHEKIVNKVIDIQIENISPNPAQPRTNFDMEELASLAESIRLNGVLQPLTVRKLNASYELIAGERRLRAAKLANLTSVPCIALDASAKDSALFAVMENLQRQNLTFFEEARAYQSLILDWEITQEQAAERLGKAQSTIANKLRLLKLDLGEQKIIVENALTERHARSLLRVENKDLRKKIIENVILQSLNVNQTEALIDKLLEQKKKKKVPTILIKDIRIFFNTVDKAIDIMKNAGLDVRGIKIDRGEYIEYVVTIAKEIPKKNNTRESSAG